MFHLLISRMERRTIILKPVNILKPRITTAAATNIYTISWNVSGIGHLAGDTAEWEGGHFEHSGQTSIRDRVFKCSMDSSDIGGPRYQLSGSRFDPIRVRVTKILSDLVKIRKIRIWSLICVRVWTRDSVFKVWLHPSSLALHRINFQDQNRTICVDSRPRFCFPKIRSIYVSYIVSDTEISYTTCILS